MYPGYASGIHSEETEFLKNSTASKSAIKPFIGEQKASKQKNTCGENVVSIADTFTIEFRYFNSKSEGERT